MKLGMIAKGTMLLLLAAALPTALPGNASAHGVTVFAWVEGDTIHTESKFSGGREVHEGNIAIYDAAGHKLLEGSTDDRGRFSFTIPPPDKRTPGDLKIVLTAGAGHGNQWTVTAAEMAGAGEGGKAAATAQAAAADSAPAAPADVEAGPATALGDSACLSEGRIEQIVRLNLERQIGPLRAQLAQPAWGLRDIVAGFGYILGLVGLAAYLHSRRQGKGAP